MLGCIYVGQHLSNLIARLLYVYVIELLTNYFYMWVLVCSGMDIDRVCIS